MSTRRRKSPRPHPRSKNTNLLKTILNAWIVRIVSVVLSLLASISMHPAVQAWFREIISPRSSDLCLPGQIVGNDLSLDIRSLVRASNKAYWHYFPGEKGIYIQDPTSEDANSWRWIYMQQLACRLEKRPKYLERQSDDIAIEKALEFIGKSRRDFNLLKPYLLRSNKQQNQSTPS